MEYRKKLYKIAASYLENGWSVIPIWGKQKPDKFKLPAVSWRLHQHEKATTDTLENWFLTRQFGGLAIVCGAVSQLAVLDFDDPLLAKSFAEQHPDLTETRIVRSGQRALPHYYFHIPSHLTTRSRHVAGADWQYNGRYVIAPPTENDNQAWQLAQDVPPKILTESDLSRIMTFLDTNTQDKSQSASEHATVRKNGNQPLTQEQILQRYKQYLPQGRNRALFLTACDVRDSGGLSDELTELIARHIHTSPQWAHSPETPAQRQREAQQTIASVFSRAPRSVIPKNPNTLPNSLREKLLQQKQTALLRVLEMLVAENYQPEQVITQKELIAIGKQFGIGQWSVLRALQAIDDAENRIFVQSANAAIAAMKNDAKASEPNATRLRDATPSKNRGRPILTYLMPSIQNLCERFGVAYGGGDVLQSDALKTVSAYRQAFHVALIRRRPAMYTRSWLAARIGVSLSTLQRYHRATGVDVVARFHEQPIGWHNVSRFIPSDAEAYHGETFGTFLEDENAKRYPPFQRIARQLLRQKRRIVLKRQLPNLYRMRSSVVVNIAPQPMAQAAANMPKLPKRVAFNQPQQTTPQSHTLTKPQAPTPRTLTDHEHQIAQRLYDLAHKQVSLKRCQQWVMQYGAFAVDVVCMALSQRDEPVERIGGLVTYLLREQAQVNAAYRQDEYMAAEGLFLVVKDRTPRHALSWKRVQQLVKTYGVEAVRDVMRALYDTPNVKNAAGFIITHLKQQNTTQSIASVDVDALQTELVNVTRRGGNEKALSNRKARELIQAYGVHAVQKALVTLSKRQGVVNPAGFVIVYLRSQRKAKTTSKPMQQ